MVDTIGSFMRPLPGSQPVPPLRAPVAPPSEPVPTLRTPVAPGPEPMPSLRSPDDIGATPAPGLRVPVAPPVEPRPTLSTPAPGAPVTPVVVSLPGSVPIEPLPALSSPEDPPPMPAPGITPAAAPAPQRSPRIAPSRPSVDQGDPIIDPFYGNLAVQASNGIVAGSSALVRQLLETNARKSLVTNPPVSPPGSTAVHDQSENYRPDIQKLAAGTDNSPLQAPSETEFNSGLLELTGPVLQPNDSARENSGQSSLRLINQNGRLFTASFSPSNLFNRDRQTLKSAFTDLPSSDPSFKTLMGQSVDSRPMRYSFDFEDTNGSTFDTPQRTETRVHLPFSFTDLRPVPGLGFRTVYLQPFDLKINETFAPKWNMQQFYGRVDPVATYQSTGRTFSIKFKLVSFRPDDLEIVWNKLSQLASMVYPEYDQDLRYRSGPVVRMRVGNLTNAVGTDGLRGIPGVITAMTNDYGDSTWEIEPDLQLPREVSVSIALQVLHSLPVGTFRGLFGGIGKSGPSGYQTPKQISLNSDTDPMGSPDDFRLYGKK